MTTQWSEDAVHAVGPEVLPRRWIAPLTVGLITIGLYLPSIGGSFVNLDDDFNFVNNLDFRGFGPAQWRWALGAPRFGNYEPLHWLLQELTCGLFGLSPAAFHAVSVALYACVAVALYFLLLRIIDLICVTHGEERQAASCCAAAGALWFAVNPLRVECVSWASGQHYLSAGLFFILALGAYLSGSRGRAAAWFAVSLLFFPCGMALPLVLAVWEATVPPRAVRKKYREIAMSILIFALLAAFAAAILWRSRAQIDVNIPGAKLSIADHFISPFLRTALLLERSLWPIGLHPLNEPSPGIPTAAHFVFGLALLLTLVAGLRRGSPLAGIAACSIVIMLPVILYAYKVNSSSDRYFFLPGIFLAAAVTAILFEALRRWPRRRAILWAATGAVLVLLAAMSWRQQRTWRQSEVLWRHALAVDPDHAFAHHALGNVFMESGRTTEAIAQFEKALAAAEHYIPSRNNLANAYLAIGDVNKAKKEYRDVITDEPNSPAGYQGLGVCYARLGYPDEAIAQFKHTLEIDPNYNIAYEGIAKTLEDNGKLDGAAEAYMAALHRQPKNADDWNGWGRVEIRRRRPREAAKAFRTALMLAPESFETHNNMGISLMLQGDDKGALVEFNRALEINPSFQPARRNIDLIIHRISSIKLGAGRR